MPAATVAPPRRARFLAPELVSTLLHGVSQIFLTRNAWTGALFLVAIGYYSMPMAVFVAAGAALSTAVGACFADAQATSCRDGLLGYNGALIGAASYTSWHDLGPAIGSTIVGCLAGAALTHVLGRAFAHPRMNRWELPVLTAPFCIASGILAIMGAHYIAPPPVPETPSIGPVGELLEILFNSVSQVVLVDSPVSGAIILVGLFVAGWRIGLAGLGGAVGALLFVTISGQDVVSMRHGLLGFSGVLVAIALGALFIEGGVLKRTAVATIGILIAELMAVVSQGSPLPAYTWPFILSTWLMILIVRLVDSRALRS